MAALLVALKDPDEEVRSWASLALGSIGAGALPALLKALNDRNGHVHAGALQALGEMDLSGLDGRSVPALVKALTHKHPPTRVLAGRGLYHLGSKALPAMPALIKALRDDEDSVRLWAVASVGNLGNAAQKAVPKLLPLLLDQQGAVRDAVQKALHTIDPNHVVRVDAD
jgi:HEAT repeat protein